VFEVLARRVEVVGQRQEVLGINDAQQALDIAATCDGPVDVEPRAAHADVVERGKPLRAEEVHGPQIQQQLRGRVEVSDDVPTQIAVIGCVHFPLDGDDLQRRKVEAGGVARPAG
jgi:hypothetical protein